MSTPPPVPEGSKAKVTLTGTAATLLMTLAARLEDLHNPDPIVGDKWAEYVAEQINYDYSTIGVPPVMRDTICLRTVCFDRWTREFLAEHKDEEVTILNIACGLDARCHRVQWGPNVRWVDMDLPDVVELRRKLLPEPSGNYTLLAGSALDDSALASIPKDRPTAIVIEGLMMYLEEAQVHDLIRRLCDHFPSGQLMFDAMSPTVVNLQKLRYWLSPGGWMQNQGTGYASSISNPAAVEELHPGLKLKTNVLWTDMEGIKNPTTVQKVVAFIGSVPLLSSFTGYNLRYAF